MTRPGQPRARLWDVLRPPRDGFVELCGLAGAGKTQLLVDACCRTALAARAPVVLVDTEGSFDARRFREVAAASTGSGRVLARLLRRLVVFRTYDGLELQAVVCELLDALRERPEPPPFSAVFVDSVAFPLRADPRRLRNCWASPPQGRPVTPGTGPLGSLDRGLGRGAWDAPAEEAGPGRPRRPTAAGDLGRWLREIARKQVAVLVTNHMRETPEGLAPALPRQWEALVARRVLVERLPGSGGRQAKVLSSSEKDELPEGTTVGFSIGRAGVQGEDEAGGDEASGSEASGPEDACMQADSDDGGLQGASSGDESSSGELSLGEHTAGEPTVCGGCCSGEAAAEHLWPPSWWASRPSASPRTAAALLRAPPDRGAGLLFAVLGVGCLLGSGASPAWPGGVLEVCGEAGTGKTQFCLHCTAAALRLALAGPGGPRPSRPPCVCYLHSEAAPVRRLQEIIAARARAAGGKDPTVAAEAMLRAVLVQRVRDPAELYGFLCGRLVELLRHASVELLVVDAIAALFRGEESGSAARSAQLFRLAAVLKRVSSEHGVPVLVANQVTGDFAAGAGASWVKPALGHAWAACVSHRVSFHRADRGRMRRQGEAAAAPPPPKAERPARAGLGGDGPERFARLEFSPTGPEMAVPFAIGPIGVL
uniref:DNA repair protein XRCC3 n=1 Tax=Lingulaulax polyedra TaxID=160621 RepID=A0A516AGG4_LINPO|nr:DNA repair protein XRCC3 [Lingulodinium polyedra]